jgi:hypothetical protein
MSEQNYFLKRKVVPDLKTQSGYVTRGPLSRMPSLDMYAPNTAHAYAHASEGTLPTSQYFNPCNFHPKLYLIFTKKYIPRK